MNAQEFKEWQAVTASSTNHWTVDTCQMQNTNRVLAYIGGASGAFVEIDATGKATAGRYDGAVPHIGEALFQPQHTRQYASQSEAIARIAERLGLGFLLALTQGQSPYRQEVAA